MTINEIIARFWKSQAVVYMDRDHGEMDLREVLLAWHEERCKQYGAVVQEACAERAGRRKGHIWNRVLSMPLPPIPREGAK